MKAAIEQTAERQAALEAEIRDKDADAQALEVHICPKLYIMT